MKKIYLLLLILATASSYSQYWKNAKEKCHKGHQCKTQYRYDDFKDLTIYVGTGQLGKYSFGSGYCGISIEKRVAKDSSYMYVARLDSHSTTSCVSSDRSYVTFLFKSGEKLNLQSIDDIDCGTTVITVKMSDQDVETLKNETIQKIRMGFTEGYLDFDGIKEKQLIAFHDMVECIQNIL